MSELLFVSEANVAQIIKRLEKNEFIKRTQDTENKSRKIINLTEKGKLTIFSLLKEMYAWEGEFFKDYPLEDVEKLKRMLYDYSQKAIDYI